MKCTGLKNKKKKQNNKIKYESRIKRENAFENSTVDIIECGDVRINTRNETRFHLI